jgi:lysozyme family protein
MLDDDILIMIIAAEGSTYTNDPLDPGGPTKFGITLRMLQRWRKGGVTAKDVEALSRAEAEAIYRAWFIRPFAELPDGLRQNVIDMGVNAGDGRAIRLCQQLIGADVDGTLGPQTVALSKIRDWNDGYSVMRIAFYERLIEKNPTQIKWRRGWRNRALRFMAQPMSHMRGLLDAYFSERVGKAYENW